MPGGAAIHRPSGWNSREISASESPSSRPGPASSPTVPSGKALDYAFPISRSDVNGTLRPSGQAGEINLVLFDAVPGGAGHAARIAERFPELLQAARRVVEHCECGDDSSCYGCLRSYDNQRYHEQLTRSRALDVLTCF